MTRRKWYFLIVAALLVTALLPQSAFAAPRQRGYVSNAPASVRDSLSRGSGQAAAPSPTSPVLTPPAPLAAFSTLTGFEAIENLNNATPPDPTGAAGDNHVVTAVNTSFAVYDRSGGLELGPYNLRALFPGSTAFVYDPKVVYDPYDDTYVLVFLGDKRAVKKSWIHIATIPDATAADPGTWCVRRMKGDQVNDGTKVLADYPGLGYDQSRVFVTTNQFPFSGGYQGAQVLAFTKSNLYDCNQEMKYRVFAKKRTLDPRGRKADSIQPATVVGSTPSDFYMLSERHGCGKWTCSGSRLILWRVKETSGGLKLSSTYVPVGRFDLPWEGTQAGGNLSNPSTWWDPGDLRLTNAFYDSDANRLYTAHSVLKNISGSPTYREDSARWYEVAPAPALEASTLERSGYVGMPGLDLGWPAVATDTAGNLYVTASGAGYLIDEYLSAWSASVPPGSSATVAPIRLSFEGDARYFKYRGVQRWGDYNAIGRDPIDGASVWSVNAAARSTGLQTTSNWVQLVHQLQAP